MLDSPGPLSLSLYKKPNNNQDILQKLPFVVHEKKKVIKVWNKIQVIKWWPHFPKVSCFFTSVKLSGTFNIISKVKHLFSDFSGHKRAPPQAVQAPALYRSGAHRGRGGERRVTLAPRWPEDRRPFQPYAHTLWRDHTDVRFTNPDITQPKYRCVRK